MGRTPADLRAEIGRQRATIYVLAAEIGVYPGRLGQMLNERLPMPDEIADRLEEALRARPLGARRDAEGHGTAEE